MLTETLHRRTRDNPHYDGSENAMNWCARNVLRGVEQWACDCFLLRETCVIEDGRLDGLLVPMSWTAPMRAGLFGVEVKISRSDFLRGLKTQQFQRYQRQLSGLYLATCRDVCKTSEIPPGIGHLIVRDLHDGAAVCRRKAASQPLKLTEPLLWKILHDAFDQQRKWVNNEKKRVELAVKQINMHLGDSLMRSAEKIFDGIK